jgi:RNA polymerase sigma-70 factor (ECF subfamily)
LALDYLKHERVVDGWREETTQTGLSTIHAPDTALDRKQLRRSVRDAVDELPRRGRQVFKLSRQHGLTYKEIATVLDISIKTVETHMRRSFRFLRKRLSQWAMRS